MEFPLFSYNDTPAELEEVKVKHEQATTALQALVNQAREYAIDGLQGVADLQAAIASAQALLDNPISLTKDLEQSANNLKKTIDTFFSALMQPANDKTSKMANPNFISGNNNGWDNSKPVVNEGVGEFFNCTFDMNQTVMGLENGHYLATVQGFYRNGATPESYAAHNDGTEQLNALFYGNGTEKPLCSLYDYETGGWNRGYADNMAQAHDGFTADADNYINYLLVEVTDGTLKIGIKKDTPVLFDWTCFNNFRLFFIPKDNTTGIKGTLGDKCGENSFYSLDGKARNTPSAGVNIHNGKKIIIKD